MRVSPKTKWLDRFHHGFVYCCMGLTLVTIVGLGQLGYHYYVNVKPALKAERLRLEKEMLKEGSPFVSEIEANSS